MYQDKNLTCRDCGSDFTFGAGEQEFYAEKGFTNEPTRCLDCRAARKAQNNRGAKPERQMFEATCASCGNTAKVPFQPSGDKPVYCRDCYTPKSRY